jgi:predicted nucleic acid-binding protein
MFWYPRYAKEKIAPILNSEWGKLFANWGKVHPDANGHAHLDLLDRVWQLRENLAAYDALYVALAEALAATLLPATRVGPFTTCQAPG